jgi:hypothetical protein
MIKSGLLAVVAFLALSLNASAQTVGPVPAAGGTPLGASGSFTAGDVACIGSTDPAGKTVQDCGYAQLSVKSYGAKVDALQEISGSSVSGNATFTRSDGGSFVGGDAGKTIIIDGAASGGSPLVTTIASFGSATTVNLTVTPTLSASSSNSISRYANVATSQSGAGSYVPGDTITTTGGTCSAQPVFKVGHTSVSSATVNAGGSGGTNGTGSVRGTTGTGVYFEAIVTIAGGAITSVNSLLLQGDYTINPTSIAAEPVSGMGLTGATLTLKMGARVVYVSSPGNCTAFPANPVAQGSTSGSGTGATLTITSKTVGTWAYGTDDTTALQAAVNAIGVANSSQASSGGVGDCLLIPSGAMIVSSTINITGRSVCVTGGARGAQYPYGGTIIFNDTSGTADMFFISGTSAGQDSIANLTMRRAQLATAGAMVHIQDTFQVRIYGNQFPDDKQWNAISINAVSANTNEIYVNRNLINNPQNDGIYISGAGSSAFIGDIFIEERNYIQKALNAAVDIFQWANGLFITHNVMFTNGYGLRGDVGSQATTIFSNTIVDNDIDSNVDVAAYFNGLNTSIVKNHVFGKLFVCISCTNINGGNHYESSTGGLILEGTKSWSTSGEIYTGMTAPIVLEPFGATASQFIQISGAVYTFGNGPFLTCYGTAPLLLTVNVRYDNSGASYSSNCPPIPTIDNGSIQALTPSSAVNYISVLGSAAGSNPTISATGTDATVSLVFAPKGNASGYFLNNGGGGGGTIMSVNSISGSVTGGLNVTPSSTSTAGATVGTTGTSTGAIQFQGFSATGTLPTLTGTCTTGSQAGGNNAGKFTATCTSQTVIMTFTRSAPNGWACKANDLSTPADTLNQTATTTTSATFTGTTVAADVINYQCIGY